jgi:Translin family
MRRAINNVSASKGRSLAIEICNTLRQLHSSFQRIYISPSNAAMRGFAWDLNSKIDVMKASVSKVEDACYNVVLRGSEKPDGWSIDFKDDRIKRVDRDDSNDDDVGRGKRQRTNVV